MADTPGESRQPGGNVEPLDRRFASKEAVRPPAPTTERFELRDPFSEVTYRTKSFLEMVTKANQVGAIRFTAISPKGERSTFSRVGGTWHHDEPKARATEHVSPEAERRPEIASRAPSAASPATASTKTAEAERAARRSQIEAALSARYLIKRAPIQIGDVTIGQTEYRHRGDPARIAFTESTFRLSTDNNNPAVARSMVDVAEARGWQTLRVSGNEDFRRMVWLEASLRGVRSVGYEAVHADHEVLRREREARQINRIERAPRSDVGSASTPPAKQSERGGGGRKAVLAALEAVLIAKHVPERQREAVMAAASENLAARLRNGEIHRVKVYDKAAAPQRVVVAPTREVQRDRERGTPVR